MVVVLAAAVFTLAAAFFYDFPVAGLVAAVDLGWDFLGQAIFLVAVNLDCLVTSVTGWGVVFGMEIGVEWWPWQHAPSNDVVPSIA